MNKGRCKRLLALVLCVSMMGSMVPVQTRAAGTATQANDSAEADTAASGHYDENGFCKGYEIDPNGTGAWVKKTGDDACTDDTCNGYQPMTTVTEAGTTWYEISNAGQLYWFADQADNGNLLDANVRLTADIVDNEGVTFGWDENNDYAVVATKNGETVDASTLREWNPIGTFSWSNEYCFAGHFVGQGHVISGLYNNGSDNEVGIFSAVCGKDNKYAIVERVGLDNSYLYSNNDTGAIAGYADYATIRQCYNAAHLVSNGYSVGGIVSDVVYGYINLFEVYNVGKLSKIGNKPTDNIGQIVGVANNISQMQYGSCYGCSDFDIHFIGNKSLAVESFLPKKSFYNGEVAYLLNQSSATWGQNLSSENSLPNPCASDKYPVYKTCTGYTNNENEVHHNLKNGFCTNDGCEYYEDPQYNESDEVYEISNAGQLYAYADKAQTIYTKGARLTADIVVNEGTLIQEDGTPVTDTANIRTWNGLFRVRSRSRALTFDGNDHSISGLYAKGSGLQGFVLHNPGTVNNLQIKNSVFISTDGTAGGIVAGDTSYTATFKIQNCSFEGYVEGAVYAGGIAGENANTSNCYADAYVAGSGAISPIVAHPSITGSAGTITNTAYNTDKYIDGCTTSGVKGFTTDQFASGEVAYAQNQGDSDATTDTWKQTLDGEAKDSTPTLNTSKENVYRYERLRCDGQTKTTDDDKYAYTNDSSKSGKSIPDEHEYEIDSSDHTHHKCKVCGGVVAHDYTYQVADGTTDTIEADCDVCHDSYKIKLVAPTDTDGKLTYTGTGLAARTEITDGVLGETLPKIEYATVTDGTTSAYSTDVPVNAGSYQAKLTLGTGENTASVTIAYSIEPATISYVKSGPVLSGTYGETISEMFTRADLSQAEVFAGDNSDVKVKGEWQVDASDANAVPDVGTDISYTMVFIPTDKNRYSKVRYEVIPTVAKKQVIVVIDNGERVYGEDDPAFTWSLATGEGFENNSLVGNDSISDLDITLSTTATKVSGVGMYAITGVSDSTNYEVAFIGDGTDGKSGILTVGKAKQPPNMPENAMTVSYTAKMVETVSLPKNWQWRSNESGKESLLEVDVPFKAVAEYVGLDKGNYETESVTVTITRSACTHETTELRDVKEASCIVDGYSGDTYCTICDTKLASGEAIKAVGHKLTKVEAKNPTVKEAGNRAYYKCDICGGYFEDSEGKAEITDKNSVVILAKPAKKGTVLTETKSGAAYKVTSSDPKKPEVEYKAPKNKKQTKVVIPDTVTIDGVEYAVTSIAKNAFKNNKKLTEVKVGKNVTSIGESAFSGCKKLSKVELDVNLTKIGKNAFKNCTKLKAITIQSKKLNKKNIGKGAFKGISSKVVFKVPKSKLAAYKKLFRSKGLSKKARFKKC